MDTFLCAWCTPLEEDMRANPAVLDVCRDEIKTIANRTPSVAAILARLFVEEPELSQRLFFLKVIRLFSQFVSLEYFQTCTWEELQAIQDLPATIERAKIYWGNRHTSKRQPMSHWLDEGLKELSRRDGEAIEDRDGERQRLIAVARDLLLRLYASAFLQERQLMPPATRKRKG